MVPAMKQISMQDLHGKLGSLGKDDLILDVRTPEEFEEGHISGARNIDHETVLDHVEELKRFKTVYVHCRSGGRAGRAVQALENAGLKNLVCIGNTGMLQWVAAGFPVVTGK
jgi:rhodanese-related sulfurtransferase